MDDHADAPAAVDVFCVVEAADSSYAYDTGEKLAVYARAGIPQYVVIHLRTRTAEVYAGPNPDAGTYPAPTVLTAEGVLALRVGDAQETFEIRVGDVLP